MKTITVTVEIDVPDNATDNDIADFVDVEYGECGKWHLITHAGQMERKYSMPDGNTAPITRVD